MEVADTGVRPDPDRGTTTMISTLGFSGDLPHGHIFRVRCDVCGQNQNVMLSAPSTDEVVRAYAREKHGWHSARAVEEWRDHVTDYCPKHILSEAEACQKVTLWETQYLIGDTFHVGLVGERLRAVQKGSVSEPEALKVLNRTRREKWQRHIYDDIIYYTHPYEGYGLYRIRRQGRIIEREMRAFHVWLASRHPRVQVEYDYEPEIPVMRIGTLDWDEYVAVCRRLRIPKGRAVLKVTGPGRGDFQTSVRISDFERVFTFGRG